MEINGIRTNPTSCKVSIADLSSEQSGRDLSGIMHKDIIRTTRQLDCTWGIMSWTEAAPLLRAISIAEFPITYPDIQSGQIETRTFYAGNRTASCLLYKGGVLYVSDLSVSFIEK